MITVENVKMPGATLAWSPKLAPEIVGKARHSASNIMRRNTALKSTASTENTLEDVAQLVELHRGVTAAAKRHRAELSALEHAQEILKTGSPDLTSNHPLVRTVSQLVIRTAAFEKAAGDGTEAARLSEVATQLDELVEVTRTATKTVIDRLPKFRDAVRRCSLVVMAKCADYSEIVENTEFFEIADPIVKEIFGEPGKGRSFGPVSLDPIIGWSAVSPDNTLRNSVTAYRLLRKEFDARRAAK